MTVPKRPLRSDGEATRARLIESAGQLIAERGYAETTGKAIAADAGVDLASINYHFGNRDGLYRAVLIEAHRRFVRLEALENITAKKIPADEKLRELLDIVLTNIGNTKNWSISVLIRELLSPSSHFEVLHNNEITPSFNVALQIVSDVTGIPKDEPSLFYCVISSIGPCLLLMLSGAALIAKDLQIPPGKLVDHMHRFALAGLQSVAKHHRDEHRQKRNL